MKQRSQLLKVITLSVMATFFLCSSTLRVGPNFKYIISAVGGEVYYEDEFHQKRPLKALQEVKGLTWIQIGVNPHSAIDQGKYELSSRAYRDRIGTHYEQLDGPLYELLRYKYGPKEDIR